MSEPYIGEIRPFSFQFAPRGWAHCDGQLLSIAQNTVLFSLIGNTYGGDGRQDFRLPDLRGRVPLHVGRSRKLGAQGGEKEVKLGVATIPSHTHQAQGSTAPGSSGDPTKNYAAASSGAYHSATNLTSLAPQAIGETGGSEPHPNLQPFLTINFCIALQGLMPPRG